MAEEIRDLILDTIEAALDAQLKAVRRMRRGEPEDRVQRKKESLSQVDMAYDILKRARAPLHISEILSRLETTFGVKVDRESLVSSLTKKVMRGDRFLRTAKNTFGVKDGSK